MTDKGIPDNWLQENLQRYSLEELGFVWQESRDDSESYVLHHPVAGVAAKTEQVDGDWRGTVSKKPRPTAQHSMRLEELALKEAAHRPLGDIVTLSAHYSEHSAKERPTLAITPAVCFIVLRLLNLKLIEAIRTALRETGECTTTIQFQDKARPKPFLHIQYTHDIPADTAFVLREPKVNVHRDGAYRCLTPGPFQFAGGLRRLSGDKWKPLVADDGAGQFPYRFTLNTLLDTDIAQCGADIARSAQQALTKLSVDCPEDIA